MVKLIDQPEALVLERAHLAPGKFWRPKTVCCSINPVVSACALRPKKHLAESVLSENCLSGSLHAELRASGCSTRQALHHQPSST